MKKAILFALFILSTSFVFCQSYTPEYGPPLVVFTQINPWLMVIGSDVPTFVLYKKGQVIYKRVVDEKTKYFKVNLQNDEIQAIIKKIGITDSLQKLPSSIEASGASDQPTTKLMLNLNFRKEIEVYGNLRSEKSKARSATPSSFLKVYDNIINFQDTKAKEWLPDTIEVILTKYSYAQGRFLKWPVGWPNLKNPHTVRRSSNLYNIYLDKKYSDQFFKLIQSLKDTQAIEVSGQKFTISYRLPFPNIK